MKKRIWSCLAVLLALCAISLAPQAAANATPTRHVTAIRHLVIKNAPGDCTSNDGFAGESTSPPYYGLFEIFEVTPTHCEKWFYGEFESVGGVAIDIAYSSCEPLGVEGYTTDQPVYVQFDGNYFGYPSEADCDASQL